MSKVVIRLWLACPLMALSGMRMATHTALRLPGPIPIISMIQASLGSQMVNVSPSEL